MLRSSHEPPSRENAGAPLPIFRVTLCSERGDPMGAADPKFNKPLSFQVPFFDAASAAFANNYQMAVESFHLDHTPTQTSGAFSAIVVGLDAEGLASPNSFDSVTGGPSRRILTQTICMSSSGFSQSITSDTVGIPVSLANVFGRTLTLRLVEQNGGSFTSDAFGANQGRWSVTLVFYPRK